jgi:hypothetical protein
MKKARFYLRRAGFSVKNAAYYLTSFVGSGFVKRRFRVFG